MDIENTKIKTILLSEKYLSEEDILRAEVIAKKQKLNLADVLLSEGLITRSLLGQALAESENVPYADLEAHPITRDQVRRIPENTARKYRMIVFSETEKNIVLATSKILKTVPQSFKNFFHKNISFAYSFDEDIEAVFVHYKKSLETRFISIIEKQGKVAPEIINEIFEDAVTHLASDIHFEPQEKEVLIRFRIDGVLQEAGRIPKEYYENILNRIKVQAHLRIDEHFAPQDGSIRYITKSNQPLDMRIALVPTLEGEKIVIRVLSKYIQNFTLSDLGLSTPDKKIVEESGHKPFGMILVTGPTGAGKTTTLYALLKLLHHPEVNITTIEDPVEYRIQGINQIQVNPQTDLTFAKGLRSIVRQDPDIILVGEIRDTDTAEIAVNAALTGHLLLSTFHANDSATAIPRLLDMGIEPFLLASTLEVVIAQRLVRKICSNCRYSTTISKIELQKTLPKVAPFFPEKKTTLYQGKGCSACGGTGFRGRQAIFESIKITEKMEDLILKHPSSQQIWELAKKEGAHTFFEDGIEKVKNGITTLEELLRVASPE